MIIKPFEQWREDMLKDLAQRAESDEELEQLEVTCSECDGSGEIDCGCDCPKCDGTADCETCGGTGYVHVDDISDVNKLNRMFTIKDYLIVLVDELCLFAKWTNRPALDVLAAHDLEPEVVTDEGGRVTISVRGPGSARYSIARSADDLGLKMRAERQGGTA